MSRYELASTPERWAVGAAGAVLVLVPYATVTLPFRTALTAQAVMLLAVVLALGAWGLHRRGWVLERPQVPRSQLLGLAAYGMSALVGAAVGLARGNDVPYLAGQLLSMGLLPLGAAAALLWAQRRLWPQVAWGLAAGLGLAVLVHLGHWLHRVAAAAPPERLFLGNSVGAVGPALMGLLATLGLLAAGVGRRLPAAGVAAAIVLYALGSGVRGLWLAIPPAVLLFLVLGAPWKRRRSLELWLGAAGALAVLALAGLAAVRWWTGRGPDLLPPGTFPPPHSRLEAPLQAVHPGSTDGGGGAAVSWSLEERPLSLEVVAPFPVEPTGEYRLAAAVRATGRGRCRVVVDWIGQEGKVRERSRSLPIFPDGGWQRTVVIGRAPPGVERARARVACGAGNGGWALTGVVLHRLSLPGGTVVASRLALVSNRAASLYRALTAPGASSDPSVGFRLRESRTLWRRFVEASWTGKLLGHGLGATVPQERVVYTSRGQRTEIAETNYVHNFYLFLLYKLGVLGALVCLAAFTLWLLVPVAALRRLPPGHGRRWAFAAVAATWAGYLAWSAVSPEILNFRVAPLFGLLVAAAARELAGDEPSAEGRELRPAAP